MKNIIINALLLLVFSCCALAADAVGKKMTDESYFSRASMKISRGEYKDALKDLDKAISMNPKDFRYWTMRGLAYDRIADQESRTDCAAAMADFAMAIKLNPKSPEPYFYRGNRYLDLHDYKSALSDYTKSIELDPEYAGSYYNRSLVYKKLRRDNEARLDYETALKLGFKGEDLFGYGGKGVVMVFLACIALFALIIILVIVIMVKRGSLSDQIRPIDE